MKFEEASKELDIIIGKLEMGNLSLDESVKLYEKAQELIKICSTEFEKAQGMITVIKDGIEKNLK
ncbi:MAG: exodeoxyribonuclease VII small subunit [Clostridia bacterium]|nr:exodeoxyribonuclease VII small subunit [Clostridia bacterium]